MGLIRDWALFGTGTLDTVLSFSHMSVYNFICIILANRISKFSSVSCVTLNDDLNTLWKGFLIILQHVFVDNVCCVINPEVTSELFL